MQGGGGSLEIYQGSEQVLDGVVLPGDRILLEEFELLHIIGLLAIIDERQALADKGEDDGAFIGGAVEGGGGGVP